MSDKTSHTSETSPPEAVANAQTLARGTKATALAQVVTQGVRFLTNIVLARLLTPNDFGVVAIALVVSMLLDQIKDMGTGSAIIQRRSVNDSLLNAVFYLNLALGAALALLLFVLAAPLARLLGNPEATPVMQAFSVITFVTSLAQIHHSLLRRDLRFSEIAIVGSASAVATAAVSIVTAFLGLGVWALVLGTAAGAVVGTVMVWLYDPWRPGWATDFSSLRSIWGYSLNLFFSNVLAFFFSQADKVIVGRFLGSAALGTYSLAQRTVSYPMQSISGVIGEVVFPAFARRQDDNAALRSGYIRSSRVVALLTFPLMAGIAAVAAPAVNVVFGSRWEGLTPLVWILAPIGAIQSVTMTSSQLVMAKGRTDWSFRWGLVYSAVLIGLELFGLRWGLVGVAAAYAAGSLLLAPFGLMLAFHLIELRLRDYLRAMGPNTLITLAMVAVVLAATAAVRWSGGSQLLELVAGTLCGVLTYGLLLVVTRPVALADAILAIRARRT